MSEQDLKHIKGEIYTISQIKPDGVGLDLWSKSTTFWQFVTAHPKMKLLLIKPISGEGYYFIGDVGLPVKTHSDLGVAGVNTTAILVLQGADKQAVLHQLRQLWGPGTQIRESK